MSNPIVPNLGSSGKFDPAQKNRKEKQRLLAGWIEETELAQAALQAWLDELKRWQTQETVARTAFEQACIILRSANLEEWARPGLDKLQAAVTGEETAPRG